MNRAFAMPIQDFLESTMELNELTGLSRRSIHLAGKFLEQLVTAPESIGDLAVSLDSLDADKVVATIELARAEVESGYRHLFQQATIALWTHYEIAVDRFVLGWLCEAESGAFIRAPEEVKKWKISIPVTEAMDWLDERENRDLAREIIGEIKKEIGLLSGGSPDRFQRLLKVVGISIPLDAERKQAIRELWAFRNLFVHRGRFADEQFLEQYPGDEFKLNDEVVVDNARYIRFHHGILDHVAMIGDEAERILKQ